MESGIVLSSTVGSRLSNVFSKLMSRCMFSVRITPSRRDHRRLVSLLNSITSYSSRLSYDITSNRKLRFAVMGSNVPANVQFHTMPGKRRFASLLLTILGYSKGNGGVPSRDVYTHIETLGNPVGLAACISLAYAGYPSMIRTLGIVTALGDQVARRAISNTVGRGRIRTVGMRKIPSIFTSNGLVGIKHDSLKRLLSGLRTRCKVGRKNISGSIRGPIGGCSILVIKNKPTNTTSTVCSTHGNLGITIVTRHVKKRIGRAINVRGLVSIPRAAKRRLTGSLLARVGSCPISVLRRHHISGIRLSKSTGLLAASANRHFSTPTLVITANTD